MTLNKLDQILTPTQIIHQTASRTEAKQSDRFAKVKKKNLFSRVLLCGPHVSKYHTLLCLSYPMDPFNRDSVSQKEQDLR